MEGSVTDVSALVRMFEEAEESTREARQRSERDRDYYDGKQWTAEETSKLNKRNQPVVTYNRIGRKVNYLIGLEQQSRKDPKAFPRNPNDEQSAKAATDALRFACDDNQWDDKRSAAWEEICVEGTGVIMVGAKQTKAGIDPDIIHVPWDRFVYDPYSRRADYSDATYMGIVTWMDMEQAKTRFDGAEEAIDTTWKDSANTETYDDRPKYQMWADYKRKRVRVVEMYYTERGVWHRCIFTKAGHLSRPEPSPYLDEEGQPENPIKAISAYVDRDNNRYGEVRAMIGPQDEVNKRRSKALHLISQRQIRVSMSAAQDKEMMRRELSKPDGVFVADKDDFEVLPTNDMALANLQMLQEAKAEIDLLGPNAALAGKNEQDQSGRAILAQQQGGMIEVAMLMGRLRTLSLSVYRAIWARIRQYWDGPRWIRVTDDERNMRFVAINQPMRFIDVAAERLKGDPEAEVKLAVVAQQPWANEIADIQNNIGEIDVDIVIDEGIDTPTVQAEQFSELLQLAGTGMVQLPPDILIEASQLKNKDKLLERMKQGPTPEQQAMQQIQMRGQVAEVAKTEAEAAKTAAQAQNEQMKPQVEAVKAYQAGASVVA